MIGKIVAYELKNRLKSWLTLLFFAMLVFQGFWYTKGFFDYYPNDGLLMNATAISYMNLAACGMLMIIIVAIATGTSLYKDLRHGTGQWIYTLPVNEKSFYTGRFLASFLYNVILALGYVVGIVLLPFSGIGEAERFGAIPWGQVFHGFFLLTIPNLFLLTSLFYLGMVVTRKIAAGYLVVFATVIAFLLMQTAQELSGVTPALAIGDPFGYVATGGITGEMNLNDRNFGFLPFSGYLVSNRALWLGIAFIAFLISYFKFSFKHFIAKGGTKKKALSENVVAETIKSKSTIIPNLSFKTSDFLKKLWSLSKLEFLNITRPNSFKIIIGVVILMETLQFLLWNASFYIGPTQPITVSMTLFRLSFGVFIMMLIIIWSGELFFKDSVVKINSITDTLPVPVWVTQLSRFVALVGMAFILAFTFMMVGIIIQVLQGGFAHLDLGLYLYDMLGYNWGWLTYVLWISVVFFVAGLTGKRFVTHIVSVGAFFLIIMAFELGLAEQVIYAYAAVPGLEDYSEISEYGIWYTSAFWYFLMWLSAAVTFVLLGIYFWNRGAGNSWLTKLSFRGKQLNLAGKISALAAVVAFFSLQAFIVKNVNGKGNFVLSALEEQRDADYEKNYGYLGQKAQPKYTHVDLSFDFYPEERRANYDAEILLTNPSDQSIDSLFLNTKHAARILSIKQNGAALAVLKNDSLQRIIAFGLTKTLFPNDSLKLVLKMEKQYQGFTQSGSDPQADLMYNGSFGGIHEYLPVIGYDYGREIEANRARSENGLDKWESRYSAINDGKALRENPFASDANKVTATIQISTDAEQIPFAAGQLVSENSLENGRKQRTYSIDRPTSFNWWLGSAKVEDFQSKEGNTKIAIHPSPKHLFNTDLYESALKKGIQYINTTFGTYPYKDLRLIETPFYQGEFHAYPNSILISEREGWYADTTGVKERAYILQSTVTQLGKHWVIENLNIANVQGAEMLSVALPEAIGLQILQKEMGDEALESMLQKKQDYIGLHQADEPNVQPPLIYADGADYLEPHKGAIALNKLQNTLGTDAFNRALLNFVRRNPEEPKIFIHLYQNLLKMVPESEKSRIKKLFEEVN
ncbi:MAG: hypothetical protein AAGL34_01725 [Bacteroidota bacterium]